MMARLRFRPENARADNNAAGPLLRAAAVGIAIAAVAVAAHQARHDGLEHANGSSAKATADPLTIELARCRMITPGQNAADESCRRAWAESRRRFFAPSASRSETATKGPVAAGPIKSQDRLPSPDVRPNRDEVR